MEVQLTTLQQEVITEMIECDESKSLTIMVEGKEKMIDIFVKSTVGVKLTKKATYKYCTK